MIEKSLIESDFPPLGEESSGGGKSNSIGEHTIVGIKYNFRRRRKALAIDRSLANPVILVILVVFVVLVVRRFRRFRRSCRFRRSRRSRRLRRFGGTGGHSPHFRPDFRSFQIPLGTSLSCLHWLYAVEFEVLDGPLHCPPIC